jgi:hypothetical protein
MKRGSPTLQEESRLKISENEVLGLIGYMDPTERTQEGHKDNFKMASLVSVEEQSLAI